MQCVKQILGCCISGEIKHELPVTRIRLTQTGHGENGYDDELHSKSEPALPMVFNPYIASIAAKFPRTMKFNAGASIAEPALYPKSDNNITRRLQKKLDHFNVRGRTKGVKSFYEFVGNLGKGAQGEVQKWKMRRNLDGQPDSPQDLEEHPDHYVAIKKVKWSHISGQRSWLNRFLNMQAMASDADKNKIKDLENELQALLGLDHPFIAKGREWFEDPFEGIYFVMDFIPGVTLQDVLEEVCAKETLEERITEYDSLRRLFRQIVYAVSYIHGKKLVHQDLKPDNCMVQSDGDYCCIKVIDFGLSTMEHDNDNEIQNILERPGTLGYWAAEVFTDFSAKYRLRPAHDIWALGIILVNCICAVRHQQLRHPFLRPEEGLFPEFTLHSTRVLEHNYADRVPWLAQTHFAGESHALINLVSSMLHYDHEERATAAQVMTNPFMKEVDWILGTVDVVAEHRSALLSRIASYSKLAKFDQVVLNTIADHASASAVANLGRTFRHLDSRKNGRLSKKELISGLQQFSTDCLTEEDKKNIDWLFDALDQDESGFIDYTEWLAATIGQRVLLSPDAARTAFYALDSSGNGRITVEDLEVAVGEEEARRIMQQRSIENADMSRTDIYLEEFETIVDRITQHRAMALLGSALPSEDDTLTLRTSSASEGGLPPSRRNVSGSDGLMVLASTEWGDEAPAPTGSNSSISRLDTYACKKRNPTKRLTDKANEDLITKLISTSDVVGPQSFRPRRGGRKQSPDLPESFSA